MTASFPMYDWPEIRDATDAWWAGLAKALSDEGVENVPQALLHDHLPANLWAAPDLMISQTCGYPLTHAWSGRLKMIATPHYSAEGCDGADYCSFVLVRRGAGIASPQDLRGRTAAFNGEESQSGYSALRAVFAPLARDGRFFGETVKSGGHLKSMEMVAEGLADVCAVDAVVWALARRHRPRLSQELSAIARSPTAPGLPFVTAPPTDEDSKARLRAGLYSAFADPALSEIRAELLLCGLSELDLQAYERINDIERESIAGGYPLVA